MSSECKCHTDEWCFFCEMFLPLERKCEGLLFERDKAIDEMRHRTKKQRAAHFKTESQLLQAVKTLELIAKGNNEFPAWEDTVDILKDTRLVAREALEEIKRLGEGVSQ